MATIQHFGPDPKAARVSLLCIHSRPPASVRCDMPIAVPPSTTGLPLSVQRVGVEPTAATSILDRPVARKKLLPGSKHGLSADVEGIDHHISWNQAEPPPFTSQLVHLVWLGDKNL